MGHRKDNRLHRDDELFYGYYLSAGIMMPDEGRQDTILQPPKPSITPPAEIF